MLKFLFFTSFFIIFFNYCNYCETVPLTSEEVEDGFTIVLPRQEKFSSLQCSLQIAKNDETKSDFHPGIDIKKTIKNRDGMEYVPNYYRTGKNDSCTFRIYPKILNELLDIFQMRYWSIIMITRNGKADSKMGLGIGQWNYQTSLFYMNSWSWWTERHVNTLLLQFPNSLIPWKHAGDLQYLYVDRKVTNAFTIVLPQEKESRSLGCFLKIAPNEKITDEFNVHTGINIKDKNKYKDGIEYVGDYYNSGKNDSCTFRIYPEILNNLSNGHDQYQMRYWRITTYIMDSDAIVVRKIFQFHMDSWWSWKNSKYANILELQEGINDDFSLNYRYIYK